MKPSSATLHRAYHLVFRHYGHQHWWPGDTPFEICVGAILTQNTNWGNVEKAIGQLKQAGVMDPASMYGLKEARLAEFIRPAGYYNVKAKRLRAFLEVIMCSFHGSLESMLAQPLDRLRSQLLSIKGIGPETADSMVLYAAEQASFVIDAYTRRIFARHGWCAPDVDYHDLQRVCMTVLEKDWRVEGLPHEHGGGGEGPVPEHGKADLVDYWQDYHAQLVNIGKDFCRPKSPRCVECPLAALLPDGRPVETP